jgi:hypothetical protein
MTDSFLCCDDFPVQHPLGSTANDIVRQSLGSQLATKLVGPLELEAHSWARFPAAAARNRDSHELTPVASKLFLDLCRIQ